MAAKTDSLPPLLPVIPEYTPCLENVLQSVSKDAAAADAGFAARHGALTATPHGTQSEAPSLPEHPQGALTNTKA